MPLFPVLGAGAGMGTVLCVVMPCRVHRFLHSVVFVSLVGMLTVHRQLQIACFFNRQTLHSFPCLSSETKRETGPLSKYLLWPASTCGGHFGAVATGAPDDQASQERRGLAKKVVTLAMKLQSG